MSQVFAADLVQEKIRQEYLVLKKNLSKEKSIVKKLEYVQTFSAKLKAEIASQKKQTPDVGIWFDMLKGSLETFPHDKKFSVKECPKYKSQLHIQYEPTADKSDYEPVRMSEDILSLLCSKA